MKKKVVYLAVVVAFWNTVYGQQMGSGERRFDLAEVADSLEVGITNRSAAEKQLYFACLLHTKQHRKAVAIYHGLFSGGDASMRSSLAYTRILQERGEVATALSVLADLAHNYPNNAHILHELGVAHVRQGGLAEGKVYLERAVKLDPLLPEPWYELAKISENANDVRFYCSNALLSAKPGSELTDKIADLLVKSLNLPKKSKGREP